jgi:hypothetical protein
VRMSKKEAMDAREVNKVAQSSYRLSESVRAYGVPWRPRTQPLEPLEFQALALAIPKDFNIAQVFTMIPSKRLNQASPGRHLAPNTLSPRCSTMAEKDCWRPRVHDPSPSTPANLAH